MWIFPSHSRLINLFNHESAHPFSFKVKLLYHFEQHIDLFKVNELIKGDANKTFGTGDLLRSTKGLRKDAAINLTEVKKVKMLAVSPPHWNFD